MMKANDINVLPLPRAYVAPQWLRSGDGGRNRGGAGRWAAAAKRDAAAA